MVTQDIVRLGPSPTGYMHIGTIRTGYFNYLQAKSTGGKFILRIDDSDLERNKQEYTDIILQSMEWLGLEYDELYFQGKRTSFYQSIANLLVKQGAAKILDNGAIALNSSDFWNNISFQDTIAGDIKITDTNRQQCEQLILVRGGEKLGQPTYHFCSVCDDFDMGITHIMRGVDHLMNVSKQIFIWNALNAIHTSKRNYPKFSHLGLIMKDKKKLSKRDGAASLLYYKEEGYTLESFLNFILLLGWSLKVPRGNKELEKIANSPIPKELAIELFQSGTLKASPCNFDINKLNYLNKYYLRGKK